MMAEGFPFQGWVIDICQTPSGSQLILITKLDLNEFHPIIPFIEVT